MSVAGGLARAASQQAKIGRRGRTGVPVRLVGTNCLYSAKRARYSGQGVGGGPAFGSVGLRSVRVKGRTTASCSAIYGHSDAEMLRDCEAVIMGHGNRQLRLKRPAAVSTLQGRLQLGTDRLLLWERAITSLCVSDKRQACSGGRVQGLVVGLVRCGETAAGGVRGRSVGGCRGGAISPIGRRNLAVRRQAAVILIGVLSGSAIRRGVGLIDIFGGLRALLCAVLALPGRRGGRGALALVLRSGNGYFRTKRKILEI